MAVRGGWHVVEDIGKKPPTQVCSEGGGGVVTVVVERKETPLWLMFAAREVECK